MEYIWCNHKRYCIILVNMAKKSKATSKKVVSQHSFEPTKVALATTCLGVSVVVLLAVIAITTL